MTGPGPLGVVTTQGRDLALDGRQTPARLLAQRIDLASHALDLARQLADQLLQLLVALPLPLPAEPTPSCNARSRAWRTRRVSCPVFALSVTVAWSISSTRAAPCSPSPHQLLQQRHEPHVVDVLHVLAVFDAVFGGFHGISSFIKLALSFGPALASLWPSPFPGVMRRHIPRFSRRVFQRTHCFHAVFAPHHPLGFLHSVRNALFQQSVHWLPPVGGVFPLYQLRNHDSRPSVTKLNLLYTPNTARKRPSKRGPISGRRCAPCYGRSYAAFRLFRLFGERCGPMNRSRSQRGERVAAENETPVGKAAFSPGIRAAFGGASDNPIQRHRLGPGPA